MPKIYSSKNPDGAVMETVPLDYGRKDLTLKTSFTEPEQHTIRAQRRTCNICKRSKPISDFPLTGRDSHVCHDCNDVTKRHKRSAWDYFVVGQEV